MTSAEHLVGRFSLSLPAALRRVWQEHMLLSSVHLEEVQWAVPEEREELWKTRLQKLSERRPPPGTRENIVEQGELAPGCRGVLAYASEYDRNRLSWLALLDAGKHGVWLECPHEVHAPERALSRLATVARSYLALDAQARHPSQGWFYLERGAIALPPQGDERVLAQFDSFSLDVKLELFTQAAPDAELQGGLMARYQRALALGLQGDMKVEALRMGSRVVAGFEGEELIIQVEEGGDRHLSWVWCCPGRSGDPHAPRVEFSMHSSDRVREDKTRLWETALGSMRHLLP